MTEYTAGQRIEVTFTVVLPVNASEQQVNDWIDFSVGARSDIRISNPLCDEQFGAEGFVTKEFFP